MKARVRKKTEKTVGKKTGKRRFFMSEIQAEMMPH
jgi:hypothetical protein